MEPVKVQRRASATGVICVCRQTIALGRPTAGRIVVAHVADTTIALDLDDNETTVIRGTNTLPVRNIKADRPRTPKTSTHP